MNSYQSSKTAWFLLCLFLNISLFLGLIGCQHDSNEGITTSEAFPTRETTPSPESAVTFVPTIIRTLIHGNGDALPPTPKPYANLTLEDVLQGWPLITGSFWVYSRTYYTEVEAGNRTTSSYLITETVTSAAVDELSSYYVVEMLQETRWIAGNNSSRPPQETFWYIIDGNEIYRQLNNLDLAAISSSWLHLVYNFPERTCWFPDSERENNPPPEACNASISGPITWESPTETVDDCYNVVYFYISGSVRHTFCPGIGFVAAFYDHTGFGYRTELIAYFSGSTGSNGVRQEAE